MAAKSSGRLRLTRVTAAARQKWRGWIGTTLALVLAAAAPRGTAAEIRLRKSCQCNSGVVCLGDVADIRAESDDEAAQLAQVELCPSPAKAGRKQLRASEIREAVALAGISLARHRFVGASRVVVVNGTLTAQRGANDAAGPQRNITKSVVAVRPLARGAIVGEADVELRPVSAAVAGGNLLASPDDVVGNEVARNVAAGRAVTRDDIRQPLLVQKGATITVFARAEGIRIRTEGRALGSGSLDQVILVEAIGTRQRYSARVTGTDEVQVVPVSRKPSGE